MAHYKIKYYFSGFQYWYQDDKRHRVDGPAVIRPNGAQLWYLNNECKIVSSCLE
jgi:hypothetical protein